MSFMHNDDNFVFRADIEFPVGFGSLREAKDRILCRLILRENFGGG
jgi:hypothetical protein